jgi:hypothetical protein
MQNPMFVFAGFNNEKSNDYISILSEELNKKFSERQWLVSFNRKGKLLTSRFEDVNFYISVIDDEEEVRDWYQMAKDFQLTTNPNPIDNKNFEKRLTEKKLQLPELYKDVHYLIGRIIYTEMDKLELLKIYFFF